MGFEEGCGLIEGNDNDLLHFGNIIERVNREILNFIKIP
jgi:hypothetical protein